MPDDLTPPVGTDEQEPVIPQVDPVETPAEPQIEEPDPITEPPLDPEPAPAPATPAEPSIEERYRNQRSEAMILNTQKRNLESTLNKLTSEDTPTDADLLAAYPDFSTYNAVTQQLMRDTLENKRRQLRISRQLIEQDAERKWQADLKALTRRTEYASLKGDDKFEDFVFQPKHANVDIQTLADAYLIRSGRTQPPAAPSTPTPPASSGLPRGSGGPRGPQRPAKISLEQAQVLRTTDWKEYMRQVKAGNIEELA